MINKVQQSGSQLIKKDEVVFAQGEEIKALSLLLQGKAEIYVSPFDDGKSIYSDKSNKQNFRICSVEKGIFAGGGSLFVENDYSYSCKVSEDSGIYFFPAGNEDDVKEIISTQKDYGAYIMNSLCSIIESAYVALCKIKEQSNSLNNLINKLAADFTQINKKYNFEYASTAFCNSINLPLPTDAGNEKSKILKDMEYYLHLNNLPTELRKGFFGTDAVVTGFNCANAAEFLNSLITEIKEYLIKMRDNFAILYSDKDESIFSDCLKAAGEISAAGNDTSAIFEIVDCIIEKIAEVKRFYELEFFHACDIDMTYIKCKYTAAKASAQADSNSSGISGPEAAGLIPGTLPDELRNSARKILEYSEIPEEKASLFLMNLFSFRNLEDRLATDENTAEIRNVIISLFFEIYEAVFTKAFAAGDKSRLISMFLLFGYMDEKLLTQEQALDLYQLAGRQDELYHDNVYNMKKWLSAIYSREREPSISEFGQDYNDIFREMKRRKEVTDRDKIKFDNDVAAKVNYEITNLLRTSHKVCHGQLSIYFPVLHSEIINKSLTRAAVTTEIVTESINKILEVDFSAFHREINFRDEARGIEKELIMKQVMPDIIIVPAYGSNCIMWQEIASRNRSNPGRLILPAFTDESVDDMIIKLVGNFRWELCRTIMGSAWNDLTEPSLTSEYTDYVQFFKKNKDLADETKDKLKAQIQKYHSKTRDIFTADYETWVKYESKGGVRLNKTARNIMFKYCPFVKAVREQLEKSPIYSEIASKYKNTRNKTARELEGRYMKYSKSRPLLPDLEHNLQFYRDM